eukprot:CAMPEP_0172786194 /NCGR_PEP_ID=MMETSP1074-20121228/205822_1 /TAXON_ID=2916 /ORGANISM="Ceratium fusus, Strain PA161109" /LENGTH=461 /DNA_ID=CAMNT_0013623207 /DNA_START=36 /DNA_END=1423 /DNA_ORIENTATION=-
MLNPSENVPEHLGFGEESPTHMVALAQSFSVAGEVQPHTLLDGNSQEALVPLNVDDACKTSCLRFRLSDKVAVSSAEAKQLWPTLRLPSMKPQGSACHMSRLGQGEFSKYFANSVASFLWLKPQGSACHMSRLGQGEFSTQFAYQVASFLWFQRDPAGVLVTHRSLSIDWAGSCKIIWIMSTGVYQRQQHTLVDSADEYSNSGGLWIETNKDTFKLLNGSAMSRSAHHQVEVAFQKGGSGWSPDLRWFVGVWVDGVLCRTQLWSSLQNARSGFFRWFYPPRLHPGELKDNLRRGGRDASFVVEWIGGGGEVTDLRAHSGELVGAAIPNISLYTQLKPQHEARLNLIANGNDTNAHALVASGGGHQVPGSTFMNPLACLPKNKAHQLDTQLKPQHEARLNLIANGNDTNADAPVACGGGHQVPGSTFMNPLACLPKNKAASKCCGSASKAPDTEVQFGGGIR